MTNFFRNKLLVTVSAALVVIIAVAAVAFVSGKGAGGRFLSKNADKTNNTTSNAQTGSVNQISNSSGDSSQNNAASKSETSPNSTGTEADNSNKPETLKNVKVHAVYLSGDSAGNKKVINHIIELSKTTDLNAVVIDVKEAGKVNYISDIPEVKQAKAQYGAPLYNPESVIKTLHDNNIYVIGRVVCFRDTALAVSWPDLAVKKVNGELWKEGKFYWTNPYKEEVWKYNIEIAKEAVRKGFDEIQFDYVRFPTTRKSEVNYGENMPSKADTIIKYLETAKKEIQDNLGVPLSADVFGIICESPGDVEGIGQVLERVGKDIDYISPMVYPSHYANASHGSNGNGVGQSINGTVFTAPDMEPYKVVYNSLVKAKNRISKVEGYKAKIRPYLQAFTASWLPKGYYQKYGAEQIRQQIKAVYDAGYEEWILWDPANAYPEAAFDKKQ